MAPMRYSEHALAGKLLELPSPDASIFQAVTRIKGAPKKVHLLHKI